MTHIPTCNNYGDPYPRNLHSYKNNRNLTILTKVTNILKDKFIQINK